MGDKGTQPTKRTNNRAESFKTLIKLFMERKEAPIDCMILAMYRFFKSFYAEILRGRYGLGKDHLHSHLSGLYDLDNDHPMLPEVLSPEEIFNNIRESCKMAEQVALITHSNPLRILISYIFPR